MDARLSGPDMSLNAPVGDADGGASADRVDFIACDKPLQDEQVGDAIDSDRRVKWLRAAMTVLTERELRILRERRLEEEAATLESLGDRLGISKERVRQIENRALEKLRRALTERHADARTAMI
jgi:RNA polymerase sigma-32 factor